jgi:phosphoribosylanthranilate isomerase
MCVRIKICGITTVADGLLAAELGADAIGLNFYAHSRRCVTTETAQAILRHLPPLVEPVALFVNQPLTTIAAWAKSFGYIRTLQIHGDAIDLVPAEPFHFIPAFSVRDRDSLTTIEQYLARCREGGQLPAAVLVDAHVPGEYGGTGQLAPWHLLADWRPGVPLVLAGGLTPDNVAEAVRIVQPYAVDVASGVESSPGTKDRERLHRFIDAARTASA